jgi:hypothetical protein
VLPSASRLRSIWTPRRTPPTWQITGEPQGSESPLNSGSSPGARTAKTRATDSATELLSVRVDLVLGSVVGDSGGAWLAATATVRPRCLAGHLLSRR